MICMVRRVARARGVAVGVSTEVRGRSDQQHGKEESEVHDFATAENAISEFFHSSHHHKICFRLYFDGDAGFSGEGGACMASRHVVSRVSNTVSRESSSCTRLRALLLFGVSLFRLVCPDGVAFASAAGGCGRGVAGT